MFKGQLDKEAQREAEQRRFRTQSYDVVHKLPFVPEEFKKPLTEISNITLPTDTRGRVFPFSVRLCDAHA